MSKACLVALAALPACIDPAVQGTSEPTGQTAAASTTDPTSGPGSSSTDPDPSTSTSSSGATSSSSGPAPTCDDGVLNQNESDVDCGGSCPPCDADAACGDDADCKSGKCDADTCFPLYPSCLELLTMRPGLPSGTYPLDPDADAVNPLPFFCDMEGGGWTQVFIDEFAGAPNDAWEPKTTAECGAIGTYLGLFGAGATASLTITAQKVPHSELRLVAEAVILDSWDAFEMDRLIVRLDGAMVFEQVCDHTADFTCGQKSNLCNNDMFPDAELLVTPQPTAHQQDPILLEFTSTLTEMPDNEAWGLDKVVVFVK